jgi:hypothetical protein
LAGDGVGVLDGEGVGEGDAGGVGVALFLEKEIAVEDVAVVGDAEATADVVEVAEDEGGLGGQVGEVVGDLFGRLGDVDGVLYPGAGVECFGFS